LSAYTKELPKNVTASWRKHLGSNEGQFGIDWLRARNTRIKGETDVALVRDAGRLQGYLEALSDIEDLLTAIPVNEASLEEAPLERPEGRI
jgi:hypothetical protein